MDLIKHFVSRPRVGSYATQIDSNFRSCTIESLVPGGEETMLGKSVAGGRKVIGRGSNVMGTQMRGGVGPTK